MLSDNQKRLICRSGFGLLCALPPILIALLIIARPGRNDIERELAYRIGTPATIDSLSRPRPGQVNLSTVSFNIKDDSPGADARPWIHRDVVSWKSKGVLNCQTTPDAIDVKDLSKLVLSALRQQSFGEHSKRPVKVHFDRLTIKDAAHPAFEFEAYEVQIQQWFTSNGWQVAIEFRPNVDGKLIQFKQEIQKSPDETIQSWSFDTANQHVPVRLFQDFVPELHFLGHRAQIQGSLIAEKKDQDWKLEFKGRIDDVDLNDLIGEATGFETHGLATVERLQCSASQNRIQKLSGILRCNQGVLDGRLVQRLSSWPSISAPLLGNQPVTFYYLGIQFQFENGYAYLASARHLESKEAMAITLNREPLLQQSSVTGTAVPIPKLLNTLIPRNNATVPLTRESLLLLKLFGADTESSNDE